MSCGKNNAFLVENLFNELKTEGEKRIARLNLGVKDSDSLTWGNINGNIYDLEDLIFLIEMIKGLASLTGSVSIFRLNDDTIDRTLDDIPEGWSNNIPDTTSEDILYMSQAIKQGGVYEVGENGYIWSNPIKINYYNVVTEAQLQQIDDLRTRLNEAIQHQEYADSIIDTMNQVTVNLDGSISVTGRDGEVSVWQHLDLGNYLLLGNAYGNSDSFFVLNKTGLLLAHNAVIYGTIYATDGWFAGELRAATGSFTGQIKATSGSIGGWLIENGKLKPKDVPTTALIGKILASLVDFGSTLTDLRTLILKDYDKKISILNDSIIKNIEGVNTKFSLTTDTIQSSVTSLYAIQGQMSNRIDTIDDKIKNEKSDRYTLYLLLESKIQQTSEALALGISSQILSYSKKFGDYITTQLLDAKLSLLSNQIQARVSQVDYDINNKQIENRFAELTVTPEYVSSVVSNQLSNKLSTLEQKDDVLQASILANDVLLASLGITADGIQMKGKTLSYYSTSDSENPIFICNEDGSGKLSKNKISWNHKGELTIGNLKIYDDYISTGNSNYLEICSEDKARLTGYAMLYLFDNGFQFLLNAPTSISSGKVGMYDDNLGNWSGCLGADGSGSLAYGNISWDNQGYGTLAERINWGNNVLSITDKQNYQLSLDGEGLIMTPYEDAGQYETSLSSITHTLPDGKTLKIRPRIYFDSARLPKSMPPYLKLSNTEIELNPGYLDYKILASNIKIGATSGVKYTSPLVNTTLATSVKVELSGVAAHSGYHTSELLYNALVFTKEESSIALGGDKSEILTTISIGISGITRTIVTNGTQTEKKTISWTQFFNKFSS